MTLMSLAQALSPKPEWRNTSLRITQRIDGIVNRLSELWGLSRGKTMCACVEIVWEIVQDNGMKDDCLRVCEATKKIEQQKEY